MKAYLSILILMTAIYFACSMLTGGWGKAKEPYSDRIYEMANFATSKISSSINTVNHLRAQEVFDVYTQVVSGMNYRMVIAIVPTECKKNGNDTEIEIEKCNFLQCGPPMKCNVTIWDQPWLNKTKVTKTSCQHGDLIC